MVVDGSAEVVAAGVTAGDDGVGGAGDLPPGGLEEQQQASYQVQSCLLYTHNIY